MPSGNFGTAELHLHGSDALQPFFSGSGHTGFLLGQNSPTGTNSSHGVTWAPSQRPGMALTFGGARQGKGAGTLIPALLTYAGSCVAIDVKGELSWITAERRRKLGQKVVILDPFDEVNRSFGKDAGVRETITKYNPLAHLDPLSSTFADDVAAIVEALIWHQGSSDPFFVGHARELVTGMIAAVVQSDPGVGSLPTVRDWLNLDEDELAECCAKACGDMPNTLASRKLRSFSKSTKTNSGTIATCKEQLAFLDSDEMREFLRGGSDSFKFTELTRGKVSGGQVSIYIVLPASHLETHARFLRLCIMQGVRTVMRDRPTLTLPIAMFLDEMGTALGPMPILQTAWGLTSGYGMLCWGFLQDLTQLQRDYPKSWETFIANSAMLQVLGCRDATTSEYFSRYIGNTTVETQTQTDNSGENSSIGGTVGGSMGTSSGTSFNYGEIGRPIMFAPEIRNMPPEQELVFFPGFEQFRVYRLKYFADPRFFGMYRPDPHYPPPSSRTNVPDKAQMQTRLAAQPTVAPMLGRSLSTSPIAPTWPQHRTGSTIENFLASDHPYSGGRKAAIIAALCFWGLFLFSMFQQGRGYGFNWPPYAVFFLSIALLLWALRDAKHRAAVIVVSTLMLFWATDFSGGLVRMASIALFSYPRLALSHRVGGVPIYELIWPLFLFDAKFRELLYLTRRNGYTRKGLAVILVISFDSIWQRVRVTVEGAIFVAAAIALTYQASTGGVFLRPRMIVTPWDVAEMIFLFLATAAALFMAIPMWKTLGRPSPKAHELLDMPEPSLPRPRTMGR